IQTVSVLRCKILSGVNREFTGGWAFTAKIAENTEKRGFYRQDRRERQKKHFHPWNRSALSACSAVIPGGQGFYRQDRRERPEKNTPILETARRSRRARR